MPRFVREAGTVVRCMISKDFAGGDEDQAGVHNQALPQTL